ncbi:MAG: peptidylprolyl isomerase [Planctomycetaceae bacterium]
MICPLLALLPLLAPPEVSIPTGAPIQLDGKVEAAEWADAAAYTRPLPRYRRYPDRDRNLRLRMKRTGPSLAISLDADLWYDGEVLRIFVSDDAGAFVSSIALGIGSCEAPPALWRRGPPAAYKRILPECPRACLVRLDVGREEGWSAEYLVGLGSLGIGRGEARRLKALFAVTHAVAGEVLVLPESATDLVEPSGYALLTSPDGWGAGETWPATTAEESLEYDDHELLYRLFLEHADVSERITPGALVISNAVKPRSLAKITALREQLAAGEARNPTLPAWRYFHARLCHEGNLFREARALLDGIPAPLRGQEPFAVLAAEHFLDMQDVARTEAVCERYGHWGALKETRYAARKVQEALAREEAFRAADEAKVEKNPIVRIETSKGDFTCELFEDDAVHAVRNLVTLAADPGYYEGMRFHMVAGGLMARVGDPRSRPGGAGGELDGPEWRLEQNGSPRPMLRGMVAMIPVQKGVLHGSQFMVTVAPILLDQEDAEVFGRVLEGQEVVDSLEQDDVLRRIVVVRQRRHQYEPLGRIK